MKYLLLDITDPVEQRAKLNEFVKNSPYNNIRLFEALERKYPWMNWTYKQLDDLLNRSVNMDIIKINQICSILFPIKQIEEFSKEDLRTRCEEIHEQLTQFRKLMNDFINSDNMFDEKEYEVLKRFAPVIQKKFLDTLKIINMMVNKPFQTI